MTFFTFIDFLDFFTDFAFFFAINKNSNIRCAHEEFYSPHSFFCLKLYLMVMKKNKK